MDPETQKESAFGGCLVEIFFFLVFIVEGFACLVGDEPIRFIGLFFATYAIYKMMKNLFSVE